MTLLIPKTNAIGIPTAKRIKKIEAIIWTPPDRHSNYAVLNEFYAVHTEEKQHENKCDTQKPIKVSHRDP